MINKAVADADKIKRGQAATMQVAIEGETAGARVVHLIGVANGFAFFYLPGEQRTLIVPGERIVTMTTIRVRPPRKS